jgi:hypothetical protein
MVPSSRSLDSRCSAGTPANGYPARVVAVSYRSKADAEDPTLCPMSALGAFSDVGRDHGHVRFGLLSGRTADIARLRLVPEPVIPDGLQTSRLQGRLQLRPPMLNHC